MSEGKFKLTNASAKIEVTHLAVPTVQYDFAFKGKYKAKSFSMEIITSIMEEYYAAKSNKKYPSLQSVKTSRSIVHRVRYPTQKTKAPVHNTPVKILSVGKKGT